MLIIGTHDHFPDEIIVFLGHDFATMRATVLCPTVEALVRHLKAVEFECYEQAEESVQIQHFDTAKYSIEFARECVNWQHLITLNGGKLPC